MRWLIIGLLAFKFLPLYAQKQIKCVTNFPIDVQLYNEFLEQKGFDGHVVLIDMGEYEKSLKIKKSWFSRLFNQAVSESADHVIFFNLPSSACKRLKKSGLPKEKLTLFLWEPKTVIPQMYEEEVLSLFSRVYTWDDLLVDHEKFFKFYYPVLQQSIKESIPFQEKKLCTLVSSDLKGKGRNELYSQRKEAISYFESVQEKGFEFYGRRWNPELYTSYRGEIGDKLEVLKNYRFCLCYENTQSVYGYVTEKIFDCFAARVVPIYWGASNIEDYVPKSCFIDRRDFATLPQLHAFLQAMTQEEYEEYLVAIQSFLQSSAAQKFSTQAWLQIFYEAVGS